MSGRDCQDRDEGLSACGCDVPVAKTSDDDDDVVEHLWQVRDIQFGLVSGALLGVPQLPRVSYTPRAAQQLGTGQLGAGRRSW